MTAAVPSAVLVVNRPVFSEPVPEPEVEQRSLADYDAALGIEGGVAS